MIGFPILLIANKDKE